jgi:hypothetical protein
MRRLELVPDGWPCTFKECYPGFFVYKNVLCIKTEYAEREREAFCADGSVFWGPTRNSQDRDKLIVTPCSARWREDET